MSSLNYVDTNIEFLGECPRFIVDGEFNMAWLVSFTDQGLQKQGILRLSKKGVEQTALDRMKRMSQLEIGPIIYKVFEIGNKTTPDEWSSTCKAKTEKNTKKFTTHYKKKIAVLMEKFDNDIRTLFRNIEKTDTNIDEVNNITIGRYVIHSIDKLIQRTAHSGMILIDIKPRNAVVKMTSMKSKHVVQDVKLIDFDDDFCTEFNPRDPELVNVSRYVMCVLFEFHIKVSHPKMYAKLALADFWTTNTVDFLTAYVDTPIESIIQLLTKLSFLDEDGFTVLNRVCKHYFTTDLLNIFETINSETKERAHKRHMLQIQPLALHVTDTTPIVHQRKLIIRRGKLRKPIKPIKPIIRKKTVLEKKI